MSQADRFDFSQISVLVVDDNLHMRRLVRDILHAFGVRQIYEASDGADAFMMMRVQATDIIICDWVMENVSGIELLRQVRSSREIVNPDVSFIMMTAHAEQARVLEAQEAGVTTFLAKPFSTSTLYERFSYVVEHSLYRDTNKFVQTVQEDFNNRQLTGTEP